ncbi:MAG: WcaI family glycosyltransferase [Terracidiphilus sp.]|nr:WcaI family glycosyltransferase [Terracidiphilus sp.]
MMRILIFSINYWPEVTGIGAFTTYRAEYLAGAGHEVDVCTAFPYYPEWRVAPEYAGKFWMNERHKGVNVRRGYTYVPKKVTSRRRILHESSYIVTSLLKALRCKKPDVLLVVSPPLGLAFNAILLSKLWQIPYVFDVEDLQPDSAVEHGMLPDWISRLLYKVESAAYRSAALVTTLTAGMRDRIISKGVAPEKVTLVEPRMDDALVLIDAEEGRRFRSKYGIQDQFLVTYSGNVGVKQALDVVVEAATLSHTDASTLFLIVGDGSDKTRIEQMVLERKLTNVLFLPLLDEADFRGLLSASGACVVTQRKSASEIAFPSKVVTYLGAGCAVVVSANSDSEVAETIRESGGGMVCAAEDGEALLQTIEQLKNSDLKELRHRAREYASQRWSSERVLRCLERNLKSAVTPDTSALVPDHLIRR